MKRSLILCFLLIGIGLTARAQIPSTLGWYEIPNTKMDGVCQNGPGSCTSVIAAWSGGILDTQRNRMIIFGGGHNDYGTNEVYALTLNGTPSWSRLTTGVGSALNWADEYAGGCGSPIQPYSPQSVHTENRLAYLPTVDRMFLNSAAYNCRIPGWVFSFASNSWERKLSSGIQNGFSNPALTRAATANYDLNTGLVFLVADNGSLFKYDYATDTVTILNGWSGNTNWHSTSVVDPVRKRLIMLGQGVDYYYDISGNGSYIQHALNSGGDRTLVNASYPALDYDPVAGRIVGWPNTGNNVYSLNPATNNWEVTNGPGNAPPARYNGTDTGTMGRWRYSTALGGFVLINDVGQNAYFYRFSNGTAPTPDTQVPTVPTNLAATTSGPVVLNWTASTDNVAVVNYRIERCAGTGCSNFVQIATSTVTSFTDSSVVAITTYQYRIRAADAAGNLSGYSNAATVTTPAAAPVPVDGLIGYWSLNAGTGSTAADTSGQNNNGVLVNAPTWVTGQIGQSLSFASASDQYVRVSNAATLNPTGAITIAAWINANNWNGNRRIVQKGSSDNQYRLTADQGNLVFHLAGVGSNVIALPSVGIWHHIAVTYDGAARKIYLDGVQAVSGSASGAISSTTDDLFIATKTIGAPAGDHFDGKLDEIRIYNRALTASEVAALANISTPPPSTTYQVGTGKPYTTIGAAVSAAPVGSVIEIDAGIYQDEIISIDKAVTLKGIGGKAFMKWGTGDYRTNTASIPNGKGMLLINAATVIDSMEFAGAKVVDNNGAGIRYQSGDLTIRNSYFHHNQNGILGEGGASATLIVENNVFDSNGFCPSACGHNLYIGNMGKLVFRFNKSVNSLDGSHTLKSRANVNEVISNFLSTKNSDGSLEADFPNGGTVYFIGNVVEQGINSSNSSILAFAAEGASNPTQALHVVNNTFFNWRTSGTFIQVSGSPTLAVKNNAFANGGTFLTGATADLSSDKAMTSSDFANAATGSYHLVSTSTGIDAGINPGAAGAYSLVPSFEYVEPAGSVARVTAGSLDIGAYEFGISSDPCIANPLQITGLSWPTSRTGSQSLAWNSATRQIVSIDHRWPLSGAQTVLFTDDANCKLTVTK